MVSVASGTATCVMAWKTAWTGATKRRAVIFSIHRTPGLIIRFRLWSTTVDRLVKSTLSKRLLKRINSNVGRNPVLISLFIWKISKSVMSLVPGLSHDATRCGACRYRLTSGAGACAAEKLLLQQMWIQRRLLSTGQTDKRTDTGPLQYLQLLLKYRILPVRMFYTSPWSPCQYYYGDFAGVKNLDSLYNRLLSGIGKNNCVYRPT